MKLSYENYCDFYAKHCNVCKGNRRNLINKIWIACDCQDTASAKWRLDQIQIYPEALKYKNWCDFTGVFGDVQLTEQSFIEAKTKALEYCFGSSDPKIIAKQENELKIDRHLHDGQNVVIFGDRYTGKSLIGILILKEIIRANARFQKNMEFAWIKSSEIIEAARWSSGQDDSYKNINYDLLDHWSDVHFLFIDDVDTSPVFGDHRQPPDIISLNRLFSYRLAMKLPTILICSERVGFSLQKTEMNEIWMQYGKEFYNVLTHFGNLNIYLKKSGKK